MKTSRRFALSDGTGRTRFEHEELQKKGIEII